MLTYKEKELHVEKTSLRHVASIYGTPVYVYSKRKVEERLAFIRSGLPNDARICFPVKCNFNLTLLDLLRRCGVSFDVASEGELRRVVKIGADPSKVVFTGVGKTQVEIEYAMDVGIGCFHVESRQELERIESIARSKNSKAPIAVRVNGNVQTSTHQYNTTSSYDTKFGIPLEEAEELYIMAQRSPYLSVEGVHCHVGSLIMELEPYIKVVNTILSLVNRLKERGVLLKFFDIGGGFGVRYRREDPELPWDRWLRDLARPITDAGLQMFLEPGRSIVAESGVLLTTVQYVKQMPMKKFVIVDAAMNDFIRPALYNGYHEILNVNEDKNEEGGEECDVVGPLCESSDIMGLKRRLSARKDDLLVVNAAGAYGSSIMSNFSSRTRPPEVMVDGDQAFLIKERETYDHVMSLDRLLPIQKLTASKTE